MRIQIVMQLVGQLLIVFGGFTLVPFLYGTIVEKPYMSFLLASAIAFGLGALLYRYGHHSQTFSLRDGFLVVASTWVLTSIIGAIPFVLSGVLTNPFNAIFESTSGLTATGATIIPDVNSIPRTFVLWRGLLHWVGGMGIIVLILSFLKNLGADAAHLFNAEASVPKPGVVLPRIRSMATKLWRLYIIFTIACFILLWIGGISAFDALNYSFSIMATGGFAPTSEGAFDFESSNYICFIFILFMIIAGGNFTVYYSVWQKGLQELWRDFETRMYWGILSIGIVITVGTLWWAHDGFTWWEAFRDGTFTLVSIQTGSGFALTDYDIWPSAAQMMLFVASFFGGCSGSTTGGIKIIRIIILIKTSIMFLRKSIHPDMVQMVRVNGKPMPDKWIQMTQQFFFFYIAVYMLSVFGMVLTGVLPGDALQLVTAFLSNVGLGFNTFGPTDSLDVLSNAAQVVAVLDMLLGRLELFTILVMLHPQFWEGYFIRRPKQTKRYEILWSGKRVAK